MGERTYIVAQLGARMHYAVPRILQESGHLERLYTDICAARGWPKLLNLIPNSLRSNRVDRLLSRIPRGIPLGRITAFNDFGCEYAKRRNSMARDGRFLVHLWAGKEFCGRILGAGLGSAGGVFTFNSAGLEVLQAARRKGLRTVMEQTIAPMRIELQLRGDEAGRFPGWEASNEGAGASDYCDREEEEWKSADAVICGSEFVRDGIAQCGGPVEKCVVVPYGVDVGGLAAASKLRTEDRGSPRRIRPLADQRADDRYRLLRVLTVGTVGLRKGSPYVLEAAKQLKGKAMFRMVGSIGVTREAEQRLREHLELTGPVPGSELAEHFAWADLFLLPSLCEGSATVTYEALAYGLPVICTPNTGSVIRDGMEGFIVPIRDAAAIVERLERFRDDPELLEKMSKNASARATEFTVAKYGDRLTGALPVSRSN